MAASLQALGPLRLPFLILTPACILPAWENALFQTGAADVLHLFLILLGALTAHISVNTFNEYFDYRSGLDLHTTRTPFSGGSGTLPARPALAGFTLGVAVVSLGLTLAIGVYFLRVVGPGILPIGLLGVLIVLSYTPWITRHPLICLLAPGVAFGPLMTVGTHLVLTGSYDLSALLLSLPIFFFVNNLLLLNQLPDVEPDRRAGRRTFPIVYGLPTTRRVYALFMLLGYGSLIAAVMSRHLPAGALLGLATLVLALPTLLGVLRYSDDLHRLRPCLGLNVGIAILTPSLIAIGMHLR